MSHNKNNEFYETLTDRIHEGDITVRELFNYRREGLLSKEELCKYLTSLLDPATTKLEEKYYITNENGVSYEVTKERYEKYQEETDVSN